MKAEDGFANLKTTRDIIDSFPEYKGLQIHITEFNSSYTPQGVIHDTNLNAAFIAQQLSRLGDVNESYSSGHLVMCLKSWEFFYTIPRRLWTGCQWLYYQADLLDICFLQKA